MKIELRNLTHTYDIDVLQNLNFTIEGYQSIALIGASGSGKSTLLRLMSGLEKPSVGSVTINEWNVLDPSYKNHIGFVFQNHNLFPHLTLKRNISLILQHTRGFSGRDADAKAIEYLTLVQLSDQMHKYPHQVSGGQAQRASIARAFAMNPDIIFMDEPTSSLDPVLTFEVLSAVKSLRTSGKKFIFVTHVINFVKEFADYVIFMDSGVIVEHGQPSILAAPQSVALKRYISYIL
jgi:ABC-type polar amino acid transport system ATPase subunit